MSMSAVEPGSRLSDRFLLEDRVHQSGGATLWKAMDEGRDPTAGPAE